MKRRSQSSKAECMTMYEKKRLNNLELNASRMEAAGLGSLAKQILLSNCDLATKKIVSEEDDTTDEMNSDDLPNGDGEYQPSENDDGEEEVDVVQNSAPAKKGLIQQTTMVELAMARSMKFFSSNQQQPIPSEKEDGTENERDLVQNSAPIKKDARQPTMVELAMARSKKKKSSNQQQPIPSEKEDDTEDERGLVQNSTPAKKDARQKIQVEFAMTRARAKLPQNQQQPKQQLQNPAQQPLVQTTQQKRKLVLESTQKQKRVQSDPKSQGAPPQQALQLKRVQSDPKSQGAPQQQPMVNKKIVQGNSDKQNELHRSQFCPPRSLALYRHMKQRQHKESYGKLPSPDLPPTSLEADEAVDDLLNSSQLDEDAIDDTLLDSAQQPDVEFPIEALVNNNNQSDLECHERNKDSTSKKAGKKDHRGPTLMSHVHHRSFEERRVIILDENTQPVAPKDTLVELSNFLGTLAKNPEYAPLNILDWKYMPTKEHIWNYVKEKFNIPEEGKSYVLEAVNIDWRKYKWMIKKKHYTKYETDVLRWDHRPATIPDIQFRELLDYWDSSVGKEIANKNTANRQKHEDVHTLGPCSIARLRYELEQNNPNKEPPTESMVYKESR